MSFNVLLQVLDEGRLTDGQGRTVDFPQHADRADVQSWRRKFWLHRVKARRSMRLRGQVMGVVRASFPA